MLTRFEWTFATRTIESVNNFKLMIIFFHLKFTGTYAEMKRKKAQIKAEKKNSFQNE